MIQRLLAGLFGVCCAAIPISWWFQRSAKPRRARFWIWAYAGWYAAQERAAGRLLDGREWSEVPWSCPENPVSDSPCNPARSAVR